eukprot:m.212209 g.212209  ORF g.212209 m.212209 type:complete len:332 (+) comp26038_c0_seq1:321-1316(+)
MLPSSRTVFSIAMTCALSSQPAVQAAPHTGPVFAVLVSQPSSSVCYTTDGQTCVTGGRGQSGPTEQCVVRVLRNTLISSSAYSTSSCCSMMMLGNRVFSESVGPQNVWVVAGSLITWDSSASNTSVGHGWTVCGVSAPAPTASMAPTTVAPTVSLPPVSYAPTTLAPTQDHGAGSDSVLLTLSPTASLAPASFAPTTVTPTTSEQGGVSTTSTSTVVTSTSTLTRSVVASTTVSPTPLPLSSTAFPTTVSGTDDLDDTSGHGAPNGGTYGLDASMLQIIVITMTAMVLTMTAVVLTVSKCSRASQQHSPTPSPSNASDMSDDTVEDTKSWA